MYHINDFGNIILTFSLKVDDGWQFSGKQLAKLQHGGINFFKENPIYKEDADKFEDHERTNGSVACRAYEGWAVEENIE